MKLNSGFSSLVGLRSIRKHTDVLEVRTANHTVFALPPARPEAEVYLR
jgi:hypothetical protein